MLKTRVREGEREAYDAPVSISMSPVKKSLESRREEASRTCAFNTIHHSASIFETVGSRLTYLALGAAQVLRSYHGRPNRRFFHSLGQPQLFIALPTGSFVEKLHE